jgi:hypothetical protein
VLCTNSQKIKLSWNTGNATDSQRAGIMKLALLITSTGINFLILNSSNMFSLKLAL